jgi:transposase
MLAQSSDFWLDDCWIVDSTLHTPVPCGMSRPTVKRSELAGWAGYHPGHPLGCHRRRISDRIVFDKLLQLLRFGCSYQAIADTTCSASTIRNRRDEWITLGVFARLKQIALASYDRIVGLVLDQIAVDGSITKAPGGGERQGRGKASAADMNGLYAIATSCSETLTGHRDNESWWNSGEPVYVLHVVMMTGGQHGPHRPRVGIR